MDICRQIAAIYERYGDPALRDVHLEDLTGSGPREAGVFTLADAGGRVALIRRKPPEQLIAEAASDHPLPPNCPRVHSPASSGRSGEKALISVLGLDLAIQAEDCLLSDRLLALS